MFRVDGEPCLADVNDSGTVNTADLLAVIAAWGTCPSCPEDIAPGPCAGQGDGVVNVADLLLVIAQWGFDCGGEEEQMSGSSQSGNHANDLEIIAACLESVLAQNLTGEEFLDAFMACLEEHGIFDP